MPNVSLKHVFVAKLLNGVHKVSNGKSGTTLTAVPLAGAALTLILPSAASAETGNSLSLVPHSEAGRAYVPPVENPFFLLYPLICNL